MAEEYSKEVSQEQLRSNDGKEGRKAWVAIDGIVYDLSESRLWRGGQHMKRHQAGCDLTDEISASPHGPAVMEREVVKRVGRLKLVEKDMMIPPFLESLLERFPILRRHPHPAMVHFPIAYAVGCFMLLILEAMVPRARSLEGVAFAMLVLTSLFTPPAILTGLFTWWINYGAKPMRPVKIKLVLAVILALAEIVCLALRIRGPMEDGTQYVVYFSGVLVLSLCVAGLGWFGGQLTFPYKR